MSLDECNMSIKMRKLSLSKPEIQVHLYNGPKTTYSTGDRIEGVVSITPWFTTCFTSIVVAFQGELPNHLSNQTAFN